MGVCLCIVFLIFLSVYQASPKGTLESISFGLFLIHRGNAFTYFWVFALYWLFSCQGKKVLKFVISVVWRWPPMILFKMTKEPWHTDWDSHYSEDLLTPWEYSKMYLEFFKMLSTFQFWLFFFQQYADRTYPLLILGSLMFIPGFYHVRIAYYAWKGYRGYSFEDIPDFDWLHGTIYSLILLHM